MEGMKSLSSSQSVRSDTSSPDRFFTGLAHRRRRRRSLLGVSAAVSRAAAAAGGTLNGDADTALLLSGQQIEGGDGLPLLRRGLIPQMEKPMAD